MKVLKSVLSLVLIGLLGSCGNLRIKAHQPFQAPAKAQNIALTSFYLSPPELARVPKADAKSFNAKVFKMEQDLITEFEARAKEYLTLLDQGLEMQMGLNTLAGAELEATSRYKRSVQKQELESLTIAAKKKFKNIILAEGSMNFFEFKEGDLKGYIEESPRLRSAVRSNLKNLDSEIMAVANARLSLDRVTRNGALASLKLKLDIYLFDDQGKTIGHGYGETEPINVDGTQFSDFELVLDQYGSLQKEVLTAMTAVDE